MLTPSLSIVLATYNGSRFLREQLDSVYSQTLQANEVLAVDDCSTDGTVAILEEYHQRYGLKYVVNEHNLRVNANFERGVRMATGDYISLCDQDDVWFKEKSEILYNKLFELEREEIANGNVDGNGKCTTPIITSGRNIVVNSKLKVISSNERESDTDKWYDTILYHLSQGSNMMMNRACLKYILPFASHESGLTYDLPIGIVVAMIGRKYDFHQALMLYRVHENNLTISENRSEKYVFLRHRHEGFVPYHTVQCLEHVLPVIEENCFEEKVKYVKSIISCGYSMNLLKRANLYYCLQYIPVYHKIRAFIRSFANVVLMQKR